MIQQHPLTSPNTVLIGAGVCRGKVIAKKLVKAGVGKGWSVLSSKAMGPEEHRRYMDIRTSVDMPQPITMKLDHQVPSVSYSEAASRPPQMQTVTKDTACMCNVRMRDVACEKEKAATWATLDCIE